MDVPATRAAPPSGLTSIPICSGHRQGSTSMAASYSRRTTAGPGWPQLIQPQAFTIRACIRMRHPAPSGHEGEAGQITKQSRHSCAVLPDQLAGPTVQSGRGRPPIAPRSRTTGSTGTQVPGSCTSTASRRGTKGSDAGGASHRRVHIERPAPQISGNRSVEQIDDRTRRGNRCFRSPNQPGHRAAGAAPDRPHPVTRAG